MTTTLTTTITLITTTRKSTGMRIAMILIEEAFYPIEEAFYPRDPRPVEDP